VTTDRALSGARELALQAGMLCGISSGANYAAARQVASKPENRGKTIVFIVCDTGERYISTGLFS
jgi:cysteine synthase A